jgi:hypothetical protein
MLARVLTLIAVAAVAGAALAGDTVYRWTDENGRLHYSDQPGPNREVVERVDVRTGSKVEEESPTADPEAVTAQRAEKCAAKRVQFSSYNSAVRLVEKDALGREHEYTADERDALIAKTQAEIDQLCVDEPSQDEG